jgi:hypothetical protein
VAGAPRIGVRLAPEHTPPADLWVEDFTEAHEQVVALGATVLKAPPRPRPATTSSCTSTRPVTPSACAGWSPGAALSRLSTGTRQCGQPGTGSTFPAFVSATPDTLEAGPVPRRGWGLLWRGWIVTAAAVPEPGY